MEFVFLMFIRKWIEEGRFPREELRVRPWIRLAVVVVIGGLGVAVLIAVL